MTATTQQQQKQAVAAEALKYIESGMVLGVMCALMPYIK